MKPCAAGPQAGVGPGPWRPLAGLGLLPLDPQHRHPCRPAHRASTAVAADSSSSRIVTLYGKLFTGLAAAACQAASNICTERCHKLHDMLAAPEHTAAARSTARVPHLSRSLPWPGPIPCRPCQPLMPSTHTHPCGPTAQAPVQPPPHLQGAARWHPALPVATCWQWLTAW